MQTDEKLLVIREALNGFYPYKVYGKVNQVVGLVIEGKGPISSVGDAALIHPVDGTSPINAEVVGFKDGKTLLMPLGDLRGIGVGSKILSRKQTVNVAVGEGLLGRVIDGLGNPMDGKGPIHCSNFVPVYRETVNPMKKKEDF